jgi:hypothetical protein
VHIQNEYKITIKKWNSNLNSRNLKKGKRKCKRKGQTAPWAYSPYSRPTHGIHRVAQPESGAGTWGPSVGCSRARAPRLLASLPLIQWAHPSASLRVALDDIVAMRASASGSWHCISSYPRPAWRLSSIIP